MRSTLPALPWALLCLAPLGAACYGDLSGVRVNHDMQSAPLDLAGGGGNSDGSVATGGCALPYVGVLIASNNGSGTARGRVERLPIDGRAKCKPLTLGNTLPPDADAVAFIAPDRIAVGALSGVYQVRLDDKAAAPVYKPATFAWTSLVDDLFPLVDQSGKTLLAVAYDHSNLHGSKQIEFLVTLDQDQEVSRWEVGSDKTIRIGFDPVAMSQSAVDPHQIFVVKGTTDTYAAGQFAAPWDGQPVEVQKPIYQLNLGSTGQVFTVKPLRQDKGGGAILRRTAWTFRPTGNDNYQVYMASQTSSGKQLLGPYVCNLPACATGTYAEYADAIPDFTDDTAVIALCNDAATNSVSVIRHVVRIRDNGSCELLLDGNDLLSQEYPQRLTAAYEEPAP